MNERLLSTSICLLLLTSMAPTVAAVGPNDSVIWGISYDWGNYENDIEELTGIDTNAVNEDPRKPLITQDSCLRVIR